MACTVLVRPVKSITFVVILPELLFYNNSERVFSWEVSLAYTKVLGAGLLFPILNVGP